jgi:hypothetical protein
MKQFFFLIGIALPIVAAAAPATKPSDPFQLSDDPSQHHWELLKYVSGTPTQVAAKLNKEVIRLALAVREDEEDIADIKKEIAAGRASAIAKVRHTGDYRKVKAEKDEAERDLEAARSAHDSGRQLAASSRYNHAKDYLDRLEAEAIGWTRQIKIDENYLARLNSDVKKVSVSLNDAKKWRATLVDVIWNDYLLRWPLIPGKRGILREIVPEDVLDKSSFIATFKCFEATGVEGKEAEGIVTVRGFGHPVKILISGWDGADPTIGKPIGIYKTMEIVGQKQVADDVVYLARRVRSDFDVLSDAVEAPPESETDKSAREK